MPTYYTVVIPYTDIDRTIWHPTDREGPFSTLTRGAFKSADDAREWARAKLGGTAYSIKRVAGGR